MQGGLKIMAEKLNAFMEKVLGKSWVPSALGILLGFAEAVKTVTEQGQVLPTDMHDVMGWVIAVGLAWWGIKTKASNVSNAPVPGVAKVVDKKANNP
jgi:hypothetical protein